MQVGTSTIIPAGGGGAGNISRHAENINAQTVGGSFDLAPRYRMPPIEIRTINYTSRWNLQWIGRKNNKKVPLQVVQESVIEDAGNRIQFILPSMAQKAGKNLAQLFRW